MPRCIVHHDGWFFEWSTVVDAPVTYGMKRDEFEQFYREQYGAEGMSGLADRLKRAVENGTSFHDKMSAQDLIAGNRAGKDEVELSFDDLIRAYCTETGPDARDGEG